MLFITLVAHILIFFIAPTQNMLITSNYITNVGTTSYMEVDMQQLITGAILKTFPLSFIGCVAIALVFSLLFSRGITSPILSMGKAVDKMMSLDQSAQIVVSSSDEIGNLAKNINELYGSLLSTIRNLEKEKENVSIAEREKSDFLRMASHELKTPVTELNATLENMILGIGEYKEYDIYLPKCKEITAQLGKMITDILSTSRLQIDADMDLIHDFSLKEFLSDVCEPFRLIAEAKNVSFELLIGNDISLHLSEKLLKKAVSNILLNAVNYTEAGKHIAVQVSANTLSITNECNPIPAWVKNGYTHIVTAVNSNGKAVLKGGERCVLLGKKVNKTTSKTEAGINTWVSVKVLQKVGAAAAEPFKSYKVKVTADELNIRKGPGTGFATNGSIKDKGVYTIVLEDATGKWGKLKSGAGWISLAYTKTV